MSLVPAGKVQIWHASLGLIRFLVTSKRRSVAHTMLSSSPNTPPDIWLKSNIASTVALTWRLCLSGYCSPVCRLLHVRNGGFGLLKHDANQINKTGINHVD